MLLPQLVPHHEFVDTVLQLLEIDANEAAPQPQKVDDIARLFSVELRLVELTVRNRVPILIHQLAITVRLISKENVVM